MHGVVVSQKHCQLAQLFFFFFFQRLTYLPPSTISRTWIFSSPSVCVETAVGKGQQVSGNAGSKTAYIQRATRSALMQRKLQGAAHVWHLQLFNLCEKHEHLEALAMRLESGRIQSLPLKGLRPHLPFKSIMSNEALHKVSRHIWQVKCTHTGKKNEGTALTAFPCRNGEHGYNFWVTYVP